MFSSDREMRIKAALGSLRRSKRLTVAQREGVELLTQHLGTLQTDLNLAAGHVAELIAKTTAPETLRALYQERSDAITRAAALERVVAALGGNWPRPFAVHVETLIDVLVKKYPVPPKVKP